MKNIIELLKRRHSIRTYSSEPIPDYTIKTILSAGLYAPSGRGIFPVEFIVVKDKSLLKKLSLCKAKSSKMLESADYAIITIVNNFKSDMIIEDAAIAMIIMHLTATDLDVGSCWVHCRNRFTKTGQETEEYIRQLVNIPLNYTVEAILSLGIPEKNNYVDFNKKIDFSKVHLNFFGQNYN